MGMRQRIAFSGRPVVEPHGQHALSGHMLDTTVSTVGSQLLVQVGDRLSQPDMVRLEHRPAGGRVTQATTPPLLLAAGSASERTPDALLSSD